MIERVVLADADVDLGDVFASVTVRHGRASADDGPLASTCSLSLVNVTRELVTGFRVADDLELYLAADVPRFRGRITDALLNDEGLSIIAVSSLSWLGNRKIGAGDWPAELWSERLARVFREAGALPAWSAMVGTWDELDPARTWDHPTVPDALTLELGERDPMLAAREAQETTLAAYLVELATFEPAAIANLPDGSILVQALTARKPFAELVLDPDEVAFAPEWAMVDDVTNDVTVEYDGGEVTAADEDSIARFEDRADKITTELALVADANDRARKAIARGSMPDWLVGSANLLVLDAAIGIGSPVRLSELPAWAPADSYVGMVEGWEDHVEPDEDGALEWTMVLALSAPRLSSYGLAWDSIPPEEIWDDAGAARWFTPEAIFN